MGTNDDICKGCLYGPGSDFLSCNTKPIYKGEQCPCITCIVKPVCLSIDTECNMYYQFAEKQRDDDPEL